MMPYKQYTLEVRFNEEGHQYGDMVFDALLQAAQAICNARKDQSMVVEAAVFDEDDAVFERVSAGAK